MSRIEDIFLKIGSIDRRWIFIIIAVVVVIPLLVPIGMPIRATDTSKDVYDAIESLPKGSKVILSIEYSLVLNQRIIQWQSVCLGIYFVTTIRYMLPAYGRMVSSWRRMP